MRRSWIEVDLGVLAQNIRAFQQGLGNGASIIFVVKSDAYGHGAVPIARKAHDCGIDWFGVAYLDEALDLRRSLDKPGILVMGVVEPGDVQTLVYHNITPIVASLEHGRALANVAAAQGKTLNVHLKVDTGMGRLGVPWDEVDAAYRILHDLPGLNITGFCTHFAKVEPDHPVEARQQADRFRQADAARRAIDDRPVMRHMSSSRAALFFDEWDYDAVRPGIALYGYGASGDGVRAHTRPFLAWKSHVIQVKSVKAGSPIGYYGTHVTEYDTRLAVVSVGYTDGFLRTLSNRGVVLIGGKRCPVVGRVSMNWLTVDIGLDANVAVGDEVVLLGRQGDQEIWAGELAKMCRTIPYEVLTNIDPRTERRYLG